MLYSNTVGKNYFLQIQQLLRAATNDTQLFETIVNAPFSDKAESTSLDLGIVVFLLVNKKTKTIDRIALSDTDAALGTVKMSEKPFHEIRIPLGYKENAIARAIESGAPQFVYDWKYLFVPALDAKAARFNQAGGGIEFSAVFPLKARSGGAIIFSYFQIDKNIQQSHHTFMQTYAKLIDQRLIDLSGK